MLASGPISLVMTVLTTILLHARHAHAENYCDAQWQCPRLPQPDNIQCKVAGETREPAPPIDLAQPLTAFGAGCTAMTDVKTFEITDELKETLLYAHNQVRSDLASGNVKGYKKAAKMMRLVRRRRATTRRRWSYFSRYAPTAISASVISSSITQRWDPTLARLAEMHVRNCTFEHDCHSTSDFPMAGQNLYIGRSTAGFEDVAKTCCKATCDWFKECEFTDSKSIADYTSYRGSNAIGHFTQLARDTATVMGCAISGYKDPMWWNMLVTCNYDITTITNKPVYEVGSKACGNCPNGVKCSPVYPGLCRGARLVGATNGGLVVAGVGLVALLATKG